MCQLSSLNLIPVVKAAGRRGAVADDWLDELCMLLVVLPGSFSYGGS